MSFSFDNFDDECGISFEKEMLLKRIRNIESNISIMDKIIGTWGQDASVYDVLNFWDEGKEEVEWFIRHVRAVYKLVGKDTHAKSYIDEGEKLFLRAIKRTPTELANSEEYQMLVSVHKFSGLATSLGWVLMSHKMMDELESHFEDWLFAGVKHKMLEAVGEGKTKDFLHELDAELEIRNKRKGL